MKGLCAGFALLVAVGCQREGSGPPADCQAVGTHAAAFSLGNYAPVEERAPTVARFVARCREVGVDQRQGACVLAAADVWSAAVCAPRLFPDVKVGGDCDAIARRIGDVLRKEMSTNPAMAPLATKATAAMRASCEQDGWTPALKSCVMASRDLLREMDQCEKLITRELKAKIDARMQAAMSGG
jgi:hypothetical protein